MQKRKILILILFISITIMLSFFGCSQKIYQQEGVQQLAAPSYLEALDAAPEAYLLDIRTGFEYRRGHLERAKNISYLSGAFGRKVAELDTTKTVFIYCETAHRSPMAARKLWKKGFRNIIDLEGGYRQVRKMKQ